MATSKKPTAVKDTEHLDDLDNWNLDLTDNDNLPAVPADQGGDVKSDEPEEKLKLPDASAAQTRARSNITPDDNMRSWINRIDQDRLSRQYDDEPEVGVEPPPEQLRIPGPTRDQLPAVLSRGIRVGGKMNPEWHRIGNLPGYQNRNIRRMGDDIFGMMTRTPHGQIQTIAHVSGQGPNTLAEVNAVAAWLREHGRDLGQGNVNFGDIIPGYRPEVQNYSAMGVRFHLVRDPMGYFIYAWPESDSLSMPEQPPQLRENKENSVKVKLTESEKLWSTAMELQSNLWTQQLVENLIMESTLSKLIGGTPGGQALVAYLHKKHRLSNTAEYTEHPLYTLDRRGQQKPTGERVQWRDFKWNPDYFMIIQGTQGVAGIKPFEEDIKRGEARAAKKGVEYDPAFDNTLRYQIVAFEKDRQIDPALLKSLGQQPGGEDNEDEPVSDPTVMRARGGLPSGKDTRNLNNIFDKLSTFIGRINAIYYARTARPEQRRSGEFKDFEPQFRGQEGPLRPGEQRYKDLPAGSVKEPGAQQFTGAVEREKIAGRAAARKPEEMSSEEAMNRVWTKIQPVFTKIVYQAVSLVNSRVKRFVDGGDFDNAQKLAGVGKRLKSMLADIDISGPITLESQPQLRSLIARALSDAGVTAEDLARGSAADYTEFLDALRTRLMTGA